MNTQTLTSHQEQLQRMGITLPSSPKSAQLLLQWIARGGVEADKRIAILKAAERDYVGKRVRHKGDGRCGKVRWILFRGMEFRAAARQSLDHRFTHPLDASVAWDNEGAKPISIGSLEVISEG